MNRPSKNIEDQIFLVAGGTSGVGKATALSLAEKWAKVVLINRLAERSQNTLISSKGNMTPGCLS